MNLEEAVKVRQNMMKYQGHVYLNLVQQVNTKCKDILQDDLGNQFVQNCGRDVAGEVVRSYFDTSDYYITVDQMVKRLFEFDYHNEYDPLSTNEDIRKSVYNYTDHNSSTLSNIIEEIDSNQVKLFEKTTYQDSNGKEKTRYEDHEMIKKSKDEYAGVQTDNQGNIIDEYTDKVGEYITDKNGNHKRRQEVEHTQSVNAAGYNQKYLKEKGIADLKEMLNSDDNFAMMDKSANASKGDVKVYGDDGNDITHRATPKQLAEAFCDRWEADNGGSKIENLKEKGYLNEEGKVPKTVKKKLVENIKTSQNAESKVILKNADYKSIGKEAVYETKVSLGKIISGQLIYFGAPPLFYEVKKALTAKHESLDAVMDKISRAGKRIGKYLLSKMKAIFKNVAFNSLKKLVKTFMDILINLIKATIKKMMKMVKTIIMSTIDAVRIIANKDSSRAEKADAVTNLYAVAVTNIVVEVLFELIEKGANLPEWMLKPLQLLTSVVCTNATMSVLQKSDLFDVKYGFKMNKIRDVFNEVNLEFDHYVGLASEYTQGTVHQMIQEARADSISVYNNLTNLNPYEKDVSGDLKKVADTFNMDIQFEDEWLKFMGLNTA
ncbi:hypothetical protein ACO1PF_10200 [Alkalibacterium sp. f15]|uniref:hypothetical protein n=1 Tax=Alkalibacterium sp. f15 TaxID=3414029 RepID=UPI003BF79CEA